MDISCTETKTSVTKTDLNQALKRNEFQLHYQPKLDLNSGNIIGLEALIRWRHPQKGLIPPTVFIPIAEETGLISPIGEWVLHTACEQNVDWQKRGFNPMVVSVNLSVYQLYQPDIIRIIQQTFKNTGLSPEYLEIEITESMMMDVDRTLPVLRDLKRLGLQISLDDFGTGYSSLYYLKECPIDRIKIDQSFVRNCSVDQRDATIVKTIIAMAHQLKLEVIAEGVETEEHLQFLQENLCNNGQGYLFSKPLPPQELEQNFKQIEQIILRDGLPKESSRLMWLEEALEQAKQELQETVRQQQGMIFKFIKRNGKFIHTLCDGELLYRLNMIPENVIGKELSEFLGEYYSADKLIYYRRAWDGEENVTYEGKLGDIFYIATLRPIKRAGKVVEVIGSCIDITDRKNAEEALKLSELKYRLIAENVQDLIAIMDINGTISYASPSRKKISGLTSDEYEGNSVYGFVHPDDRLFVKTLVTQLVSSKKPVRLEFRYKHALKNWIGVEAIASPVIDENNEVVQIVAVSREKK